MKCPQCKKETVIVESVDGGGKVKRCHSCGWRQVEDKRGKGLLTDDMPATPQRVLTEGA